MQALQTNVAGKNETLSSSLAAAVQHAPELLEPALASLTRVGARQALVAMTTYDVRSQECVSTVEPAVLAFAIKSEQIVCVCVCVC